jgi:hypothetical protein
VGYFIHRTLIVVTDGKSWTSGDFCHQKYTRREQFGTRRRLGESDGWARETPEVFHPSNTDRSDRWKILDVGPEDLIIEEYHAEVVYYWSWEKLKERSLSKDIPCGGNNGPDMERRKIGIHHVRAIRQFNDTNEKDGGSSND